MKNSHGSFLILMKKKTLIAFLILVLFLAGYFAIIFYSNILSYMEFSSQTDLKVDGIINTLNRVQMHIYELEDEFRTKTKVTMEIMTDALRPHVIDNAYDGPEYFEDKAVEGNYDGVIVQVEEGNIIYPERKDLSFPKERI